MLRRDTGHDATLIQLFELKKPTESDRVKRMKVRTEQKRDKEIQAENRENKQAASPNEVLRK